MLECLTAYHSACAAKAQALAAVVNPNAPVVYIAHPWTGSKCISTFNFSTKGWDKRTFGAYSSNSPSCLSVAPSSDGRLAAVLTGGVNKLVIFNSDTEKVILEIAGTFSKIIGWRPATNDVLAVLDGSGYIKFYNTTTGTLVSGAYSSTRSVLSGAWSPDGTYIGLVFSDAVNPGAVWVAWSVQTALTWNSSFSYGYYPKNIVFLPGRTGANTAAVIGCAASTYLIYLTNGETDRTGLSSSYFVGSTNLSIAASSTAVGVINSLTSSQTFQVCSFSPVTTSTFTWALLYGGSGSAQMTAGGTLVRVSPSGRYFLVRASQLSGTYAKQFNYFDRNTNTIVSGFDTGLTINDFQWDPRGSL